MLFNDAVVKVTIHKKGMANFNVSYATEIGLKAKAKSTNKVVKITSNCVRWGNDYDNMKDTQERVASGELTLTHELPWGVWSKDYPDLVIEHEGKKYIRFYRQSNPNYRPTSIYYLNGKEISIDELKTLDIVLPSYWGRLEKKYQPPLTINVENILSIS